MHRRAGAVFRWLWVRQEVAKRALDLFLMGQGVKSFSDNAALLSELLGPLKGDADATAGLEELRQILGVLFGEGSSPDIAIVAERIGTSVRTLQRRSGS